MTHAHSVSALLALAIVGCAATADEGDQDIAEAEGSLSSSGLELTLRCRQNGAATTVVLAKRGDAFELKATTASTLVFEAVGKRPSLNVRVEDGTTTRVDEFIDFNDRGLETVPVDGPSFLELDLAGAKTLLFKDPSRTIQLGCTFAREKLVRFLGIDVISFEEWKTRLVDVKAVAFDIDDTLAFTTPAFARGFATGGTPGPLDTDFWTVTNGCDSGCPAETITLPSGTRKDLPANAASTAKIKARQLVALHKSLGHRVFAITARPDINGEPVRDHVERELGIARSDVFFEPDIDRPGNPKGKTDRIESLNLDVFYGDSDSDITDALHAFRDPAGQQRKVVNGVRFLRSPRSSNRKAGQLNKYHPGYYGEPVLEGTYE
jgi:acid phosphatase class B